MRPRDMWWVWIGLIVLVVIALTFWAITFSTAPH
jgi:hypothetical protein